MPERGFSTGLGLIPGQGLGCRRRGKGFPRKGVRFWAPSGAVPGCDPAVMLQGWVQPLIQPSSLPRGGRCPKQGTLGKRDPKKRGPRHPGALRPAPGSGCSCQPLTHAQHPPRCPQQLLHSLTSFIVIIKYTAQKKSTYRPTSEVFPLEKLNTHNAFLK